MNGGHRDARVHRYLLEKFFTPSEAMGCQRAKEQVSHNFQKQLYENCRYFLLILWDDSYFVFVA